MQKNATIIDKVWLEGTNDFQQRIPNPTQAGLDATISALLSPMNNQYFNQFLDQLINKVGFTIVKQQAYKNKLAVFKGSKLEYGSTVEEMATGYIKAHSFEDDAETLLKMHRPEVQAWYHTQNRRDKYPITINQEELRAAFHSEDGLNKLVAAIMQSPINSDEYDEFNIMMDLMDKYEQNWGYFKHQLATPPTTKDAAEDFLAAVREYAIKLELAPSKLYNAKICDIPVFAKKEELVLFVTPQVGAYVPVKALAAAFNIEYADANVRTITVPSLPCDAYALLTTEDFFVCKDTLYENASFYNPETLSVNYWLHHWGVYSISPIVPAVLFTPGAGTNIPTVKQTVTGLTLEPTTTTAAAGETVKLTAKLTGNIVPLTEGVAVAPDSCTWEVSGVTKENQGAPLTLNARTRVDEFGVLHLQKSLQTGNVITVTATSTYAEPGGMKPKHTATAKITIK